MSDAVVFAKAKIHRLYRKAWFEEDRLIDPWGWNIEVWISGQMYQDGGHTRTISDADSEQFRATLECVRRHESRDEPERTDEENDV